MATDRFRMALGRVSGSRRNSYVAPGSPTVGAATPTTGMPGGIGPAPSGGAFPFGTPGVGAAFPMGERAPINALTPAQVQMLAQRAAPLLHALTQNGVNPQIIHQLAARLNPAVSQLLLHPTMPPHVPPAAQNILRAASAPIGMGMGMNYTPGAPAPNRMELGPLKLGEAKRLGFAPAPSTPGPIGPMPMGGAPLPVRPGVF